MTQIQQIDDLLAPIPGETPGGDDLSYSPEIDAIREARRSDDPSLAQGEWETERKVANWPRVRSLCETVLTRRSKDFQVANWYAEAAARTEGFAGLDRGLQVVASLLTDYWEFAHPTLDPHDLDERAGKIEWLNAQLPLVVREIALTASTSGGYGLLHWEESRAVANLGLRDADAMAAAIADGKLAADVFDKAVMNSGRAFYAARAEELAALSATMQRLEAANDRVFGLHAPSLKALRDAIGACVELVDRCLKLHGGKDAQGNPRPSVAKESAPGLVQAIADALLPAGHAATGPLAGVLPGGTPQQLREEAIGQLRAVAAYFRKYEPHSPVAPLVERAAKWAEMPFEAWLANVIKDESTLRQLHELLDVHQ